MARVKITIMNFSTLVTTEDLRPVADALQQQVSGEFALAWGMDAELWVDPADYRGVTDPRVVADTGWTLALFDDHDALLGPSHPLNVTYAGSNGFHDSRSFGRPFGRVFIRKAIAAATPWSLTASHELLEMLANPWLNAGVRFGDYGTADGRLMIWREVCDPCGAAGYPIDGIMVADFVHPAWFENHWRWRERPFDQMRKMDLPLQLLPEGDIWVDRLTLGWTKVRNNAQLAAERALAHRTEDASAMGASTTSVVAVPVPTPPRAYEFEAKYRRKFAKKAKKK